MLRCAQRNATVQHVLTRCESNGRGRSIQRLVQGQFLIVEPGADLPSWWVREQITADESSCELGLFLALLHVFLVYESFNSVIVVVFWGSRSQLIVKRIIPAKLIKHIPTVKEISEAAV